jgi:hypothetical protein
MSGPSVGRPIGVGEAMGFGHRLADGEHQPIGGGMENLIGQRRAVAGAVGGELALVHLDQVLGLAASAVDYLVDALAEPVVRLVIIVLNCQRIVSYRSEGEGWPVDRRGSSSPCPVPARELEFSRKTIAPVVWFPFAPIGGKKGGGHVQ